MKLNLLFKMVFIFGCVIFPNVGFTQNASEWFVPEGATARLGKGKANALTYSADETRLVIATSVGIWSYHVDTGEERPLLPGYTGYVLSVAYSRDGGIIASADEDGTVRLWNADTGESMIILAGHTDRVTSVAFSPDGGSVVSGSRDNTVRLWGTATGEERMTLPGHTRFVTSVAYSPIGGSVASGAEDSSVRVWDAVMGESIIMFTEHTGWVTAVSYLPDNRSVASGSEDGTIRVWDAETGDFKAELTGHTHRILSLAFSQDGGTLVSGGRDNTVRLWDLTTGELKATLTGHTDRVYSIAFSPDGRTVASGSRDSTVRLWDVETGDSTALIGHAFAVRSVAYSLDGGTVRLWDAMTGHAIATLTGHTHAVRSVAFSPTDDTLASGSEDGTVLFWDLTWVSTEEVQLRGGIAQLQQQVDDRPKVKIVYFHLSDPARQQEIEAQVDRVTKDVQRFYAREMRNFGYGIKTYTLEFDGVGRVVVHPVKACFDEAHYREQPFTKILEEIEGEYGRSRDVLLVFLGLSEEVLGSSVCGLGGAHQSGAAALLPAEGECFSFRIVAHELGHAFGLSHDFREPNLMSGSSGYLPELSACAAEALDAHPLFNPPRDNLAATTIEPHRAVASESNTARLRCRWSASSTIAYRSDPPSPAPRHEVAWVSPLRRRERHGRVCRARIHGNPREYNRTSGD